MVGIAVDKIGNGLEVGMVVGVALGVITKNVYLILHGHKSCNIEYGQFIVSIGILFVIEVLSINMNRSPHLFVLHSPHLHCFQTESDDHIELKMCVATVHNFTHLFQILRHPHIAHANNTQLHNHGILFSCEMQPLTLRPPRPTRRYRVQ